MAASTEGTAASTVEDDRDPEELFRSLSRYPDFDAVELEAYDATDRLLLDTAEAAIADLADGELVVIGDRHGALTIGARALLGATGIRVFQDPLLGERALAANAERLGVDDFSSRPLDRSLLDGARVVLLQLPRSLDALDEIARAIADWADPAVQVFAGGRVKHMTLTMNEVLGRSFTSVSAGLARRKSRVLSASGPRAGETRFPVWGEDPDLDFRVAAFGATFGGATLDHGTRLLLAADGTRDAIAGAQRVVDLGCGNGVLATAAARANPRAEVIATDQSAAAVAATRLTSEAAGVADRVRVHRADATEAVPDGWADLILLNPPFHSGSTVHAEVAHRLIRSSARALAPGGELRLVFNTHLAYRPLVERVIGPVEQVARTRTFTVLAARKRR
ncbi:methyltransferase [Leucobacter sp. Psy1]|uniref:class I SAM-dependent methyltransferase n=1 Tax=Leucobacter sp. Psy1 TaxID=2875729 RepID=UPI001CD55DF6|nr:methyltransferase [Leucobacter sp. Psy1]